MPACIHCQRELPPATAACSYCGAAQPAYLQQPTASQQLSDQLLDEVLTLIGRGQKLEAVKTLKNRLGVSLLEAKQIVDRLSAEQNPLQEGALMPVAAQPQPGINRQQIENLVREGKKLEAIKEYRLQAGCSLLEAKQSVDALEATLKQQPVSAGGRGCFGVLLAMALAGLGGALAFAC